jgi:hypothetical protein
MTVNDALTLAGVLVAWFVISRFVLPRMGVAT